MTEAVKRKKKKRAVAIPLNARPLRLWLDASNTQEVRIEIIPLIDVIFCILTFFILAAVGFSRQQAISLDLPKASTGAPQMREMLIISLDYAGQVYVEQQPVGDNRLYQAVESYFLNRPNGLMVLYASKDVRYDRVVQVLDVLREVGGDRVALATLPEGASQPAYPTPIPPSPGTGLPNTVPSFPSNDPLGSFGAPPIPGTPSTADPFQQSAPQPQTPELAPSQPNVPPATNSTSPSPSLPSAPESSE